MECNVWIEGSGNTSNIKKHHESDAHSASWAQLNAEMTAQQSSSSAATDEEDTQQRRKLQSKLSFFNKKNRSTRFKLNVKLVGCIVRDMRPYTIVEGEGFRQWANAVNPTYQLPCRRTLREILAAVHARGLSIVKEELKPLRTQVPMGARSMAAALSLDAWTSRARKSYVAVLLHTMDVDFNQRTYCLGCMEFPKAHHTAAEIKALVNEGLQAHGLEADMIFRGVSDQGANVVAALREIGIKGLICNLHRFQRCIIRDFVEMVKQELSTQTGFSMPEYYWRISRRDPTDAGIAYSQIDQVDWGDI